jgi:hypothetical protein
MLKKVDSNTNIHKNNKKRIIRALNYYDIYKKPFSEKEKTNKKLYDFIAIGLTTKRDDLYNMIDKRTDQMILDGGQHDALLRRFGIHRESLPGFKGKPQAESKPKEVGREELIWGDTGYMDINTNAIYSWKGKSYKGSDIATMANNSKHANEVGLQNTNLIKALESTYEDISKFTPVSQAKSEPKMSFAEWKKANPTGTPAQYKNYSESK